MDSSSRTRPIKTLRLAQGHQPKSEIDQDFNPIPGPLALEPSGSAITPSVGRIAGQEVAKAGPSSSQDGPCSLFSLRASQHCAGAFSQGTLIPDCKDASILLHVVQLLAGMVVGHAHGDERDDRDGHHVPGRCDGVARKVDQPERDERGRAAEDGVRQVKRKGEAGVAHVGRERLGEVAGQGAIVDGEQQAQ